MNVPRKYVLKSYENCVTNFVTVKDRPNHFCLVLTVYYPVSSDYIITRSGCFACSLYGLASYEDCLGIGL